MEKWSFFILLFITAWITQIFFTYRQNKHYGQTVREMSSRYDSGYLGVGVVKKRLGIGSVVILVADVKGEVVNAEELTGVTVFSRFKKTSELVGRTIEQLFSLQDKDTRTQAIKMAAEQIRQQQEKS